MGSIHLYLIFLLLSALVAGCNGIKEDKILENLAGLSDRSTLEITPGLKTLHLHQTQQFIASGGYPPYEFSLLSGVGSISSAGLYTAPGSIGTATVRVTDSMGATRDALVVIDVELSLSPSNRKLNVNSSFQFSTSGGTSPYSYLVTSGASSISSDGTFTAAATPETAIVRVNDAHGNFTEATVIVGNGPIIAPTTAYASLSSTYQFTRTSGTAPYVWSLVTGSGSVDSAGLYTAPASVGTATVRVTDANGFYSDANVVVFKPHKISASFYNTCVALGDTNQVKCWGSRIYGATGDGDYIVGDDAEDMGDGLQAVRFSSSAAGTQPLIMATTMYNGCAIFDDNVTRCWGWGAYGMTGTGISSGIYFNESEQMLPVPADVSNPIVDLARKSEGYYHQCGIYDDGTLKCWGYNGYGQLGQDTASIYYGSDFGTSSIYTVSPINLGQAALKVETGYWHSCAILADYNVKCWGYNAYGQLGLGHTDTIGDGAGEMGALPAHDFAVDAVELALGAYHTCALFADGTVRCWGYGAYGETGMEVSDYYGNNPGEDPTLLPAIDLGTGRTAVKIDAGTHHTCALLDNDKVKCWGYNGNGQLGQEDTFHRGDTGGEMGDTLPYVFLGVGRTVTDISVGGYTSCATLDTGEVKCWGDNDYGQLGIGLDIRQQQGDEGAEMGDNLPALNLGTGVTVVQSSPLWTSCFLVSQSGTKEIRCLGRSSYGALGIEDGSTGDEPSERGANVPFIDLGTTKTIADLGAEANHVCARFTDGSAKCWGNNGYEILGTNALVGSSVGGAANEMGTSLPYVRAGSGVTISKIAASTYSETSACAILDGTDLKCWGYNGNGELGQDDTTARYYIPTIAPVNLGVGRTVRDVDVGVNHTCAILDDRSVKCWGYNYYGSLGLGHTDSIGNSSGEMALTTVDLGAGVSADQICVGNYHNCVLTTDGKVKCWGYNANAELGLGHTNTLGNDPGEMGNTLPWVDLGTGRTVVKLSCGMHHNCAILDNKKLKCWGYNPYGNLGLGHTNYVGSSPGQMGNNLPYVNVGTGRTVLDVAAGGYHTCALLDNNDVKCWGYNTQGQLGAGHRANIGDSTSEMGDSLSPLDLD